MILIYLFRPAMKTLSTTIAASFVVIVAAAAVAAAAVEPLNNDELKFDAKTMTDLMTNKPWKMPLEMAKFNMKLEKKDYYDADQDVEPFVEEEDLDEIIQGLRHAVGKREAELSKSANDGEAEFELGWFHFTGRGGVSIDYRKARELSVRAAEKGNAAGMLNAAKYYDPEFSMIYGFPSPNYRKSQFWYKKAAKAGRYSRNLCAYKSSLQILSCRAHNPTC